MGILSVRVGSIQVRVFRVLDPYRVPIEFRVGSRFRYFGSVSGSGIWVWVFLPRPSFYSYSVSWPNPFWFLCWLDPF